MSRVLGRIVARTLHGVWRARIAVLLAAAVTVGLGAFVLAGGSVAGVQTQAGGRAGNDCADAAILAIASHEPGVSQRAYACMDSSYQQRVSESEFVQQMTQQAAPNVERVARIGDYRSAAGGTIVYFALEGGGQSAGYIVYLDPGGRVLRVE
jgi:hypothetical protein